MTHSEIISVIINFIVSGVIGAIFLWLKKITVSTKNENKALRNAVRALLRDKIHQMCIHFLKLNYFPTSERDILDDLLENYHLLEGDGNIDDLVVLTKKLKREEK